jgi:predicted DNA binding protein
VGKSRSAPRHGSDDAAVPTTDDAGHPARDEMAHQILVVRVQFEARPGDQYDRITHAFPEMLVRGVTTQVLPDGRALAEVDIVGARVSKFLAAVREEPGVISATQLALHGTHARCRILMRPPHYLDAANALEVSARYPRIVQNGEFTVEFAGPVHRLSQLLDALKRAYANVRILRFGRERMESAPATLTHSQQALLSQALAAGYFDVPRRITLTRLAEKLGKSKSAVSQGLALVEKKLVESTSAVPT